jgi:hypothetical protein
MLTLLRPSRALALAMVLLAPGIAGTAVQWLHACPAAAQASSYDHQHHSSQAPHSTPATGCDCIGSCSVAVVVVTPRATIIEAVVVQPELPAVTTESGFVPVASPAHLLPPATAPPLS